MFQVQLKVPDADGEDHITIAAEEVSNQTSGGDFLFYNYDAAKDLNITVALIPKANVHHVQRIEQA